jgi:hypothetical protein
MWKAKDLVYEMLSAEKLVCFTIDRHRDRQKYCVFAQNLIENREDYEKIWDPSSTFNKIFDNAFDKSIIFFRMFEMNADSAWLDLIALDFALDHVERISLEPRRMLKFYWEWNEGLAKEV